MINIENAFIQKDALEYIKTLKTDVRIMKSTICHDFSVAKNILLNNTLVYPCVKLDTVSLIDCVVYPNVDLHNCTFCDSIIFATYEGIKLIYDVKINDMLVYSRSGYCYTLDEYINRDYGEGLIVQLLAEMMNNYKLVESYNLSVNSKYITGLDFTMATIANPIMTNDFMLIDNLVMQ